MSAPHLTTLAWFLGVALVGIGLALWLIAAILNWTDQEVLP